MSAYLSSPGSAPSPPISSAATPLSGKSNRSGDDGITHQRGSLGGVADIDDARNRARNRQRHLPVGDRLAYSAAAGKAGAPDRPVAGAGVPHHPAQPAGVADRADRAGHHREKHGAVMARYRPDWWRPVPDRKGDP